MIATLQQEAWRTLYRRLDEDADGVLVPEEVSRRLSALGASDEAVADIVKALFAGSGTNTVTEANFVKRAQRLQSPMQLDLMQFGTV